MSLLKSIYGGIRAVLRKKQVEQELDDELRSYLETTANEKMNAGMNREEAWRKARIELGGVENVKEEVRATSWETRFETIWNDFRFSLRLLRFNPVFAGAAILSLALGIGANTAIFQLIDAVRLRTLPVKNPQEIAKIAIAHRTSASGHFTDRHPDLTYALWGQIRDRQKGFSEVFAWSPSTFNISPSGEVRNVEGLFVSGEFFETLGVQAEQGRLLNREDDQVGCGSPGVVISHFFWQREFGGSPSALGQTIRIERHPFTIVGITPPDFYGVETGRKFDIAAPLCAEPLVDGENQFTTNRSAWWLSLMGRLKPGWTIERAETQLRTISPEVFEAALPPDFNPVNAKTFTHYQLGVFPADSGVSDLRKDYEKPLWLLLTLAAIVLLIAAANLANLLLARANRRAREIGVRMALGASRARLMRQLLIESLVLVTIGAALGVLLADNLSAVLVASLSTPNDPLFLNLAMDWRVLGFTIALAALACVLFGLAPAIRATKARPEIVLREGVRGITSGRSRFGLRQVLVISQIALSLTLTIGALLFARSLNNLAGLNLGFNQNGILVADLDFSSAKLPADRRRDFSNELLDRVKALKEVKSAAIAAIVPLSGDSIGHEILLNGTPESDTPVAACNIVSPGYFETMQTRLLAGRDFDEHDTPTSPQVAIVNETFAKKLAKVGNPLGMEFRVRVQKKITLYQVVGLAQDTKYGDLRENSSPIVYTAQDQADRFGTDAQIVIRSSAGLATLMSSIKAATLKINPNMEITFSVLHTTIENGLLRDRLMARLSGFFGMLAVILAGVGIYGVISYTVARRKSELAIRMTVGASRGSVVRLVLSETLILLVFGLALGSGLALFGGKAATAMLFGLKPWDAATFVAAVFALALVAIAASVWPAIMAAWADPMTSLREE